MRPFRRAKLVTFLSLLMLLLVTNGHQYTSSPFSAARSLAAPLAQQGEGPAAGPELNAAEIIQLFWHEAATGAKRLNQAAIPAAALGLSATESQDPKRVAQAFM